MRRFIVFSSLCSRLYGSVDPEQRYSGRRLIVGTQAALDLRLINLDPGGIKLEGGDNQVVTTSGGAPNKVSRNAKGKQVGRFQIDYVLEADPCPCADAMKFPDEWRADAD